MVSALVKRGMNSAVRYAEACILDGRIWSMKLRKTWRLWPREVMFAPKQVVSLFCIAGWWRNVLLHNLSAKDCYYKTMSIKQLFFIDRFIVAAFNKIQWVLTRLETWTCKKELGYKTLVVSFFRTRKLGVWSTENSRWQIRVCGG